MTRGEIWQVRIPHAPGHAQAGERPALVMQNDRFNASLPTVLIIPFTSTVAAARFDGTVIIQPSPDNGLRFPSVALVFQLRALDKRDFLHRLGVVELPTLEQISILLNQLAGA